MSPRIASCLLIAIGIGFASAAWTYSAGWGLLAAFVVYSFSGSTALVMLAVLAMVVAERRAQPSILPRQPLSHRVTAHTG